MVEGCGVGGFVSLEEGLGVGRAEGEGEGSAVGLNVGVAVGDGVPKTCMYVSVFVYCCQ